MAELTGAKINVYSEKPLAIENGTRGIVTTALPLKWYKEKTMTMFNSGESAIEKLGYSLDNKELIYIREIMKYAKQVLIWPIKTGGSKAVAIITDGVTATATHIGTRGNDIKITVSASGEMWLVKTFIDTQVVDSQLVSNISGLISNGFVEFSGTGAAKAITVSLKGGLDGEETTTAWDDYLEVLKLHEFNVIAYTGSAENIKTKLIDYVKTQREDEDKFIQVCIGNKTADYEGVISFGNGVVLEDKTTLDANEVSAWLAGVTAAATITTSLTYTEYPHAIDIVPRLTKSAQLTFKNKGLGCFILNNGKVKVESDINTLITYTNLKQSDFSKNRVLRVIDTISTDVKVIFDSGYSGQMSNNTRGRNHLKANICEYLSALQRQGAIEDFISEDVVIKEGKTKDSVIISIRIKPIDSMEKAEITLWVR